MTYSKTIDDLKHQINILDVAIADCQDQYGNCPKWMEHRMNKLVEQKSAFKSCIEYFEVNEINVTVG